MIHQKKDNITPRFHDLNMYTKVIEVQRPKRALSLLTVLHNYSYILLFVSILLLLQMKRKSWYPYNRQLDIVIDRGNFASLEDTF